MPLPTTLDSVDARISVKRKMEGLVLISGKKDGSKDSELCDEICGGWPVGFGVLYIDTFIESFEVWMSIGCIDFVSSKTSKARNGTHQIRDNVFFQYAPGCNLLHGQGYFVRVTFIQASFGT